MEAATQSSLIVQDDQTGRVEKNYWVDHAIGPGQSFFYYLFAVDITFLCYELQQRA